jgi:hypothetical protein
MAFQQDAFQGDAFQGDVNAATITSTLPALSQAATATRDANLALVLNTLPEITQAATGIVPEANTGPVTNTLPALSQVMMARHANVTDWSDPASDTTLGGVTETQLIVVTAGV